ncbi:DEAD/DEAH box helicase family protein [Micromonospora sp. SD12]|uniref:DEAD/DEAH box helicase family protein n=1 Tax=Micromonospora sp. SD12 TaxID=3452216 RepID=UPI003F8BC134
MSLDEYYRRFGSSFTQPSERLFIDELLYPLLGEQINEVVPQYSFLDRAGKRRRIDFAYHGPRERLAFEVDGETYHAEGLIPASEFDDSLFRQNEILAQGYRLLRFSYSQLQSPYWRPLVVDSLKALFTAHAPELLRATTVNPNRVQLEALEALEYSRTVRGWEKGIVVLPTGTGKTILSALDAKRFGGRVLFVVHRLDILAQSVEAYRQVWGNLDEGILTGEERRNLHRCDVLFASKDSLRRSAEIAEIDPRAFDYIVIDEVHHGQSPSYEPLFQYFKPRFMLGMTATPERADRKDIFELFDYNKVYEIPLSEAIERGYLVPYTYVGLTDDIDYSRIRYQNHRYRVDDLERLLIVPERNDAILQSYLDEGLGAGDKAIGFCVSIKHADRMANFFRSQGVTAAAIHSNSEQRDELIQAFRDNRIQVAFTVDLFNEGIDFANVQVLLFLRPTESKTVFMQQLGRGLRLSAGKERVRVLDFIGNYKRANQIRKYLAKSVERRDETGADGRRQKKLVYHFSPGCVVKFDPVVEEILNQQDAAEFAVDRQDLREAYFALAEQLNHKPSKSELDSQGQFSSRLYVQAWGTWRDFLRDVGEYTEASYHYPQGTHLGHILSILWHFGLPSREGTAFADRYIRLRGGFDQDRLGTYQRQLKYKLQAAMELGILEDDRSIPPQEDRSPTLTPTGLQLRQALHKDLAALDLAFKRDASGLPSSRMAEGEGVYNQAILAAIQRDASAARVVRHVLLKMPAVQQMMAFIYQIAREPVIEKSMIYSDFFNAPFVQRFCEREGIEQATPEASRRRCPFLLNVLAACGILRNSRSEVLVDKLFITPALVKSHESEDRAGSVRRLRALQAAWPDKTATLSDEDLVILRELFGRRLLTSGYAWNDLEVDEEL